ncbi:MAG: hypothetical protein QOJ89_847 [bacterium]|jgi:hypothetical protein
MTRSKLQTTAGGLALIAALGLSACGSSSPDNSSAGPATSSQATPLVSTSAVLAAVRAASSTKSLPKDITPKLADTGKDTGFAMIGPRGCQPGFADTSIDLARCVFGDAAGKKTVMLIGDSHSSMWLPAIDQLGSAKGWKVIDINKVNCGAAAIEPYLYQEARPYPECVKWHDWVTEQINTMKPQMVIFTSSVGAFKLGTGGDNTPATWKAGMKKTLDAVTATGVETVVLGDIPYIWQSNYGAGPNCLSTHYRNVTECSAPKAKAVLQSFQDADEAGALAGGARYIGTTPWFCTSRCWSVVNKIQVYSDWQHITATYAKYLSGALEAKLGL